MLSLRRAWLCAGWNWQSLRKNPRLYMSMLLGFLLVWMLTKHTIQIANTYSVNLQIFEPFDNAG